MMYKAINQGATTTGAGTTVVARVTTNGFSGLVVIAKIGNGTTPATAAGDVIVSVQPYDDDGTTINATNLTPTTTGTATLTGNIAAIVATYDLHGLENVQVSLKNNNVAALQAGTVVVGLKAPIAV